uniref:Uncharacterized protein n=1 Tax=Zea mays TaxID=4577 RepID=A0A804M6Z0_MAIZE
MPTYSHITYCSSILACLVCPTMSDSAPSPSADRGSVSRAHLAASDGRGELSRSGEILRPWIRPALLPTGSRAAASSPPASLHSPPPSPRWSYEPRDPRRCGTGARRRQRAHPPHALGGATNPTVLNIAAKNATLLAALLYLGDLA